MNRLFVLVIGFAAFFFLEAVSAVDPVNVGSRRELFVDDFLIDDLQNAQVVLHRPTPREIVFKFDRPWEGLYSGYETVLKDGDIYRFYYRGMPQAKHDLDTEVTCVAESKDGIRWMRPNVGIYEIAGSKDNNVVLARSRGCHNLAPFVDINPNCPAETRYKALGGTGKPGLLAFQSADGLHWNQVRPEPVITKGAFDSQNNAFWSESEQKYVCYFRVFREGTRWIARATSDDFIHWSEPVDLEVGSEPREHLYTNQIEPYTRAQHLYLGLPTRYLPGRRVVTEEEARQIGTPKTWNYVNDCTDILLVSTRGGAQFSRKFMEAYVRPGSDLRNWTSRANYAARGIVQTGVHELSLYVKHHAGYPSIHVRRYTLRPDGFASVNAGYEGGELVTKPIIFDGNGLSVNFETSAVGGMRVELQTADGEPVGGFTLADCKEMIGDRLDQAVSWKSGSNLTSLSGKAIRLRFQLKDADLYSLQFIRK